MSSRRKVNSKNIVPVVIICAVVTFYVALLLFMYIWGFFTSLKSNMDFRKNLFGLPSGWPWEWQWSNYVTAFSELFVPINDGGVMRYAYLPELFLNSILYAGGGSLIQTAVAWIVAYLIAKFPYKFSKFIYSLNLILMVIPIVGSLPSSLQIYKALGLYDNWAFVFVNAIGFTGTYFLVFYGYFNGIGKEYVEAARVDGAGNFTTMVSIIFPITVQMFLAVFIMHFIARWNDYMTMVIWMPNHPTLAYGIYKFGLSNTSAASWPPMQITGCMLLMLPILLLFLCFQDYLVGNLRIGAVKG